MIHLARKELILGNWKTKAIQPNRSSAVRIWRLAILFTTAKLQIDVANDSGAGHHTHHAIRVRGSIEEYAAGQVLYYKARFKGLFLQRALLWISLGLFFVLLFGFRWGADLLRILFLVIAAYFFYIGITQLFPTRYCRRYYPKIRFGRESPSSRA